MSEVILVALFVKHFLFDYPLQTQGEITNKGKYGNLLGMLHSVKHGLGSTFVLSFFTLTPIAVLLGLLDFISHYHIDWLKVKITKQVGALSKTWWTLFGLDQLAHSLVYVSMVLIVSGVSR